MRFSAVLFDFAGILVDTEWAIYEAWHRTFRNHGHPLPLEIYTQCIGSDFDTWSPKTHLEQLTGSSFDWHQLDEARQVEIRRDLEAKGVVAEVVSTTVAALKDGELEAARAVWRRKFKALLPTDAAERAKQARFLLGRGFSTETITKLLRGLAKDEADE